MNDLISRQAAIDAIKRDRDASVMPWEWYNGVDFAINHLINTPSAQLDNIVCGDCKYWICHDRRCGYWNHGVKPLEWCCHAERKKDGSD